MNTSSAASPNQGDAEFSRLYDAAALPSARQEITASSDECAALARRFDLVAIKRLEAGFALADQGTEIVAKGELHADIVQQCAISGEDFRTEITAYFQLEFVDEARWHELGERHDGPDGDEADDALADAYALDDRACDTLPVIRGKFDMGEAVAQTLALELDPWPEGPNADAARAQLLQEEEVRAESGPFAALKALKKES